MFRLSAIWIDAFHIMLPHWNYDAYECHSIFWLMVGPLLSMLQVSLSIVGSIDSVSSQACSIGKCSDYTTAHEGILNCCLCQNVHHNSYNIYSGWNDVGYLWISNKPHPIKVSLPTVKRWTTHKSVLSSSTITKEYQCKWETIQHNT